MKKLIVVVPVAFIAGCASTVPFTVKSAPPDRTREQVQLDNLECSNLSRTNGPWVYGIGTAIMRSEAAKKYQECMSARGYVVKRGSGATGHQAPTGAQSSSVSDLKPAAASPAPEPVSGPVAQAPLLSVQQVPAATTPAPALRAAPSRSPAERLKELDDLYKSGLITKDEYDRKRQEIISTL